MKIFSINRSREILGNNKAFGRWKFPSMEALKKDIRLVVCQENHWKIWIKVVPLDKEPSRTVFSLSFAIPQYEVNR